MAPTPEQKRHRLEWQPTWRGQRLKQILQQGLPGLSSRNALLVIRNGLVTLANGGVLDDADLPVPEGCTLEVDLRHGVHGEGTATRTRLHERMQVVHDDPWVVVVNKHAGTLVQPIEDDGFGDEDEIREKGAPLVELLKHYWRTQGRTVVNPYLVQRLDIDTSGLLVLAKTDVMAAELQQQLQPPRTLSRHYIALVEGPMATSSGEWRTTLGRGKSGLRQTLPPGSPIKGQPAVTRFEVRQRFASATLVAFELETGRTHQIRIHAAESGHPVLGDTLYHRHATHARKVLAENPSRKIPAYHPHLEARACMEQPPPPAPPAAPRTLLHSTTLAFTHPHTGEPMEFHADPPEDFAQVLASLRAAGAGG